MWRKLSCLLLCIAMLAGLAGCGKADSDTDKAKDKTTNKVADIKKADTDANGAAAADMAEQNKAYGAALWDIYLHGLLPDGSKLDYSGTQQAEDDTFAIYDVDNDGREELVVLWANASVAWCQGLVYGYDNGELHEELSEFVDMRFYSNGAVEASWSHNQGLGGRIWPYNVYTYDAKTDTYRHFGAVDGWNKRFADTFYASGEPFPDDLDQDGDGLIYFLYSGEEIPTFGDEAKAQRVDGREYEAWRWLYLHGATEITLPTKYITPDNITPLGCPMP